jgi:hypothetical protein
MALSMYQISVPVCIRMLGNLSAILKKAEAYAKAKNIDSTVLAGARLYPDMYPLTRQVQIACDVAKGCGARLAGKKPPRFADNESTIPQLIARIEKTLAFLRKFSARQIDGSEQKTITLEFPGETVTFTGAEYVQEFVLPNVYFHVATAYNILRHNGLEIGKRDYIDVRTARRGGGKPAGKGGRKSAPRRAE